MEDDLKELEKREDEPITDFADFAFKMLVAMNQAKVLQLIKTDLEKKIPGDCSSTIH